MNEKIEVFENKDNQSVDDFYVTFKEKLEEVHAFPTDYIFKFILPSEQSKIARVHSIFEKARTAFSTRESKNGKYSSITVKVPVTDADDVILYYRQVSAIDGVMML